MFIQFGLDNLLKAHLTVTTYPHSASVQKQTLRGDLRRLADETNSDVDQLIGYGPTTYPTAAFGILLSTSIYRRSGDEDWIPLVINKEIMKLEVAINDPNSNSSFLSIRNGLAAAALGQRNAINALPRHGKIGCGSIIHSMPSGIEREIDYDLYGSIVPASGVPERPAMFNSQDGGGNEGDWLPGENPRLCDNQGHGWAARDYYNGQLTQMRANEDQAQTFGLFVMDGQNVLTELRRAAGLTPEILKKFAEPVKITPLDRGKNPTVINP